MTEVFKKAAADYRKKLKNDFRHAVKTYDPDFIYTEHVCARVDDDEILAALMRLYILSEYVVDHTLAIMCMGMRIGEKSK